MPSDDSKIERFPARNPFKPPLPTASSSQRAWLQSPEGQIAQILEALWAAYEANESKMDAETIPFGGMQAVDDLLKRDPAKMLELFVSQNPNLNPRNLPKDPMVTAMAVLEMLAIED